ncbi:hypothetical protein SDJN03_18002, partial [Cucurbita argyrosperma subsp. sororia]
MTNFLFKVPPRLFAQDLQKFAGNDTTISRKFLSSLSEISQSTNNRTVDYLVHTLGFSKDSALAAASESISKLLQIPTLSLLSSRPMDSHCPILPASFAEILISSLLIRTQYSNLSLSFSLEMVSPVMFSST